MGARTDDAHTATQHVQELRQLVNARLSKDASEARHTIVVACCRPVSVCVCGLYAHRAELQDVKFPITESDAFLPEEGRTGTVEFYHQSHDAKQWKQNRHHG